MSTPIDSKFSLFAPGGDLLNTDIVVGLRGGINTKFTLTNLVTPASIQNQTYTFAVATGTANAIVAAYAPVILALVNGMMLDFVAIHNNTGATTFDAGTGAHPVYINDGLGATNIIADDIVLNGYYQVQWNGAAWLLLNPAVGGSGGVTPLQVQQEVFNTGVDVGAADAYVVNLSPAATLTNNLIVAFTPANANLTSTPVISVNANLNIGISTMNGQTLVASDFQTGILAVLQYSTAFDAFLYLNPQISMATLETLYYNQDTSASDGGALNAYVGSYPNPLGGLALGVNLWINNIANANTGASTFDNGLGALPIYDKTLNPLVGGEMLVNGNYLLSYINAGALNGWILVNSSLGGGGGVTATQVQQNSFNEATDSGILNAYVGAYTPAIVGFGGMAGVTFILNTVNNTNTGASTFDNGAGAKPIVTPNLSALVGGEMILNNAYQLMYNQFIDSYVLLNSSLVAASGITPVQIQDQAFTYGQDIGAANAVVVAYSPVISAVPDGTRLSFAAANANTGNTTIDVGTGAITLVQNDGNNTALAPGMLVQFGLYDIEYKFGLPNLLNPSGITVHNIQQGSYNYTTDTGAANAYVGAITATSPVLNTYTEALGVWITVANTNSGASTFDLNSVGAVAIVLPDGTPLSGGEMPANHDAHLVYQSIPGQWVLQNSATGGGGGGVTPAQVQSWHFSSATDSGAVNAYVGAFNPAIAAPLPNGTIVILDIINATNTTAASLDVGFGAIPITAIDFSPLTGGEILGPNSYAFLYNDDFNTWTLLNASKFNSYLSAPLGVQDAAGATLLGFSYIPTATNYIEFQNNTAGSNPAILAVGADADITLQLNGKGTGGVYLEGVSTNSAAVSGQVGEYIFSEVLFGAHLPLVSGVIQDVTFIPLGAGDWDVWGTVTFDYNIGSANQGGWVSLTSATLPDIINTYVYSTSAVSMVESSNPVPQLRVSLAAPANVYLSGYSVFAGNGNISGGIYARRRR